MEILRFDEPDAPTPKRKRPSKAWLALSMVAALMGVGTAFASSTININSNNIASLGQGVSSVTSCDDNISVSPVTGIDIRDEKPSFYLSSIQVGGIDLRTRITTEGSDFGKGCAEQSLKIQVFQIIDNAVEDPTHPKAISCNDLINPGAFHEADGAAVALNYRESADGSGCEIWAHLQTASPDPGTFTISGLQFAQIEHHAISHVTLVSSESYPFS